MIKALIFDCFGVLTTDGWLPLKAELFGKRGQVFAAATELNKQLDLRIISYGRFIAEIARLSDWPEEKIQQRLETNVANTPLFNHIAQHYHGRYKLGILSNAGDNWFARLFTPEQQRLFDAVVLSCEIGASKPQPEAYHIVANRLGVHLSEAILIDDQASFCNGAEAVGMGAIHYREMTSAIARLETQLRS